MNKNTALRCIFMLAMLVGSSALADVSALNFVNVGKYFNDTVVPQNQQLGFLTSMPKGADLHNHLVGDAYPRWFISYAKEDPANWCVNTTDYKVTGINNNCVSEGGFLLQDVSEGSPKYNNIVSEWSMKGFQLVPDDYGHDHFFDAFGKFSKFAKDHSIQILADLMRQADQENISYLEVMVRNDEGDHTVEGYANNYVSPILPSNPNDTTYNDVVAAIDELESHGFTANVVENTIFTNAETMVRFAYLDVGGSSASSVKVGLKYTANRITSFDRVLTGLYAGFLAATLHPDLFVGVNLIGAEDNEVALRDFDAHMLLVQYMRGYFNNEKISKVFVSLHSGELTDRLDNIAGVGLSNMTYHISDSIEVAGASRIGHGVDLFAETPTHSSLIDDMRNRPSVVEICLTSNEQILGVCDGESYCKPPMTPYNPDDQYSFNHPFYCYLTSGVTVVISTDDQGMEQTDLVNEYYKATTRYGLTYTQLRG